MMRLFIGCCLMFMTGIAAAQDFSAYRKAVFIDGPRQLPYRLLSPVAKPEKKYPLVIFLHGAFEKGNDNELQLQIGGRFFMRDSIRGNYPAFVLFPQCPIDDSWVYFENKLDITTGNYTDWKFPFKPEPTDVTASLLKLLGQLLTNDSIDKSRVYIAGLSQGGMGVLEIIARKPETFAAGISMCGAGDPATSKLFAGKTALWLFHGDKDQVVPPNFSEQFYRRLKRADAKVRFTSYPGVEHNSWSKAFTEPDLMQWLFSQSKPG
jgi:predicted peptidase